MESRLETDAPSLSLARDEAEHSLECSDTKVELGPNELGA